MKKLTAVLAGILFGFGLAASGMTDTQKVLGFLDIFGAWDPDLAFVMGGAVVTTLVAFPLVLRRKNPLFDEFFHLPSATSLDKRLLIGAAIFGIGWGVYGYCPGPAIASIAYFRADTAIFIVTMLLGMLAVHFLVPAKK